MGGTYGDNALQAPVQLVDVLQHGLQVLRDFADQHLALLLKVRLLSAVTAAIVTAGHRAVPLQYAVVSRACVCGRARVRTVLCLCKARGVAGLRRGQQTK